MPDDLGNAPGGAESAGGSPDSTPAAVGGQASADTGNAPGIGGDAAAGGQTAQAQAPAVTAGGFVFGGRTFRDQKHAENYFNEKQVGRVPGLQRELTALQQEREQMRAQLQALQQAVTQGISPAQGQGMPRSQQQAGPQSFADKLAQSGDLSFIGQLAEEKGIGHAMYAMAQLMEQHTQEQLQQFRQEAVEPFQRQYQMQQGVSSFMGGVKPLLNEFPELAADADSSPDAAEAQQYVLQQVQQFPPEWLAQHPEAVAMAALWYRHQHGIPTFANPPGTSGSPSGLSLAAAEAAGALSSPMDGSGMPRPAPGNGTESPMDRLRRENATGKRVVKSEKGRIAIALD